jgi:ribonuclease HII
MTARWDTVAGVDEAGRGPLAGPVVAAAVMLDPQRPIDGLTDSKQLTARRRDALDGAVRERALAVGIARAEVAEIDALNILHASLAAMARAVAGLNLVPAAVRVDGNRAPALAMPTETVVGGDGLDAAIAAASIVAKVERDRLLVALEATHPGYGFAGHKGYGTRAHLEALYRLGPCPAHRRSFAPVRKAVAQGRLALEE